MVEKVDAIVVGAGLGGLTAAALLAKRGEKVLVLDQHYVAGGCASTFSRQQFIFDAAVHLIGGLEPGGVLNEILHELDVVDLVKPYAVSPMYHVKVGAQTYEIPAQPDRLAEYLIGMYPSDEEAILDTIQEFKVIGRALLSGQELNKRLLGRIMSIQNLTIRQYLEDRFLNSNVEFLLSSLYPYIGAAPSEVSVLVYMATFTSYEGGGYALHGSSQELADALKSSIERNGGQVLLRRRVEKILMQEGRACGIRDHKGQEYRSQVVISNIDLRKTYLELVGPAHLPTAAKEEINSLRSSISALVLYAGIRNDGWEQQFAHETFLFPDFNGDPKTNAYQPLDPLSQPWISICRPTCYDPTLAPAGHSVLSFMVPCDGVEMEKLREERGKAFLQETYLDLLESHFPGLKERIVVSELATPRTFERYTGNSNGSVYGWKRTLAQHKRLEVVSRPFVEGLYPVGHWVKQGHGVFGVMNGARQTVDSMQGILLHK